MQGNILQCYPVMLPSDVIPCNVTLWRHLPRADRAAHSSVKLSATKKDRLFQYSIEPVHSKTYKRLSENFYLFVIQRRLIKDFDFRTSKLVFFFSFHNCRDWPLCGDAQATCRFYIVSIFTFLRSTWFIYWILFFYLLFIYRKQWL